MFSKNNLNQLVSNAYDPFYYLLGSLYIYEQGFLFVHPRLGAILLPFSKLSKVQFYDKVIQYRVQVLID